MSNKQNETTCALIAKSRKTINRNIYAMLSAIDCESTVTEMTPAGKLEETLKVYRRVKPLLALVSALPLLPRGWRIALVLFAQHLDGLVLTEALTAAALQSVGTPEFKAGKDL